MMRSRGASASEVTGQGKREMRIGRLVLFGVLSVLVAGCGTATDTTLANERVVTVTLNEYHVQVDATSVPAGSVTFNVNNLGTEKHEFVILKTDFAAAAIPADPAIANKVQEDTAGVQHVDEISELTPGGMQNLTVALTPGTYLLVCNYPGHVHAGMVATLNVT
jgi:uncharacterized cupredoxin-like copper-binding protein